MTKLNLISPEQNKLLQLKYLTLSATNLCGLLVLMVILFGIIAVCLKHKIEAVKISNDSFLQAEYSKHDSLIKDIKIFNENLANLAAISSSTYEWDKLVMALPILKPAGIYLSSFTASVVAEKSVIIKGFAQTRDDLLAFQKNLTESGFFDSLQSPLSNFTESQKIDFEISAKLK